MSEFDVRLKSPSVTTIRFSSDTVRGTSVASTLSLSPNKENRVEIRDETFDDYESDEGYVVIPDMESAENLIKALHKAIDLGWLK